MLMHEKVMTSQCYTQKTVACAGRLAVKKCPETEFVVKELLYSFDKMHNDA